MAHRWIGRVAFALLAEAVLCAQAPVPQQVPVFRGGTTVVPLTITVLDKNGAPVKDLKESDFTVYEDGKVREILNFYPQPFTAQPVPPASTATLNRAVRPSGVVPQTSRTFLLVLGWGRIQYPTKALDGAIQFVRGQLLPQDLVAVLAFNRATDFTTDHEQVAQVLEHYKRDHERIVFDITEFRRRRLDSPKRPFASVFQPQIDALFTEDGGSIRDASIMLFGMDRAIPITEKPWDRLETLADIRKRTNTTNLSEPMITSSLLKFYAGIEYLRYLEGDKHLVYFGGTWQGLRSSVEDDKRLARRANDARVALDMIRTTGVAPSGTIEMLGFLQGMQYTAQLSGGYYTGNSMADKALANVDRASRFSYLIGYAPSNPALDGGYRDVNVTVNRKDVTVRFRHGYYATGEPEPLALEDLLVKSRMESAAAYDGAAKDVKLDVNAFVMPRMGVVGQLRVDVRIDSARLAFSDAPNGARIGHLDVQIYVGDSKQQLIGDLGERLDITADAETYARFQREGIPYTARVPTTGVPKYVKVMVFDYGSDLLGTFVLTMK